LLLFMDLDGFKEINDRYGHETGDLLLVAVARRLVGAIREQDTVARFGGDEFVVVFDGISDRNEAGALVRKVEALFAEPFLVVSHRVSCGVSVGAALYPGDGDDVQRLVVHADMKMYEEKARRKALGKTSSGT
jgi:diguanylate cyclase (GGDEF)-like protein